MDRQGGPILGIRVALGAAVAIAVALLLLGGPPAHAEEAPTIVAGPTIGGVSQGGRTLTATATYTGTPTPSASWSWLRCRGRGMSTCTAIAGATSSTYRLTSADVGNRIRVRLTVSNEVGRVLAHSSATDVVQAAPAPDPTPIPTPSPTPAPTAKPTPTATPRPTAVPAETPVGSGTTAPPTFSLGGPTPPASTPGRSVGPPILRPFPVVRVGGRFTANGAVVTLLTVRAPSRVRITVRCLGRRCPVRRWARTAVLKRARKFERRLPAGVRLIVTVTRPGWIGKRTSILIRRGRVPARVDRCLYPGSARPRRCPA